MLEAKPLFSSSIEIATDCVNCIRPEFMSNSTPCSEWDLRQLLNHMVYEVLWVPDLLAGKTVAEVGNAYEGDVLRENPSRSWQVAAGQALAAAEGCDTQTAVHLSYGDVPAKSYLAEIGSDIIIHSWDLAQAMYYSLLIPDGIAETIYEIMLPRQEEFAASGLFGTPVSVPEDSDIQTKLLALYGRKNKGEQK